MYDDKKHSPCYSGYRVDFQLNKICELERIRHESQANETELHAECAIFYRILTQE